MRKLSFSKVTRTYRQQPQMSEVRLNTKAGNRGRQPAREVGAEHFVDHREPHLTRAVNAPPVTV